MFSTRSEDRQQNSMFVFYEIWPRSAIVQGHLIEGSDE